jgi:molybdenum cofactor biosynthesis enzyme MoaA
MAKDVNDRVKRKNPKTRVWGTTSPIRQEKREDLLRHRSSQQVGVIQPIMGTWASRCPRIHLSSRGILLS